MSDDLLKQRLIGTGHGSSFEAVRRIDEMADEITRLRAEVERLREAERTAWERGRDAAADECDRMNASYNRSAKGYDEDDPLHGRIRYSAAAVAVASANIRDLQPPALTPETSHD